MNKIVYPQYLIDRFWEKIKPPEDAINDCWEWNAGRSVDGYGYFYNAHLKLDYKAHRFSYELFYGPIPIGLDICHNCDNKICVNPNHLKAGTRKENMEDCKSRGRTGRGSKQGSSVLTEIDVVNIIENTLNGKFTSAKQIMNFYNISRGTLNYIYSGEGWQHVTSKYSDQDLKLVNILLVKRKLLPDDVKEIKLRLKNGESCITIAQDCKVSQGVISQIKRGIIWAHITI
jgi:hypothetical protein